MLIADGQNSFEWKNFYSTQNVWLIMTEKLEYVKRRNVLKISKTNFDKIFK